MTLRNKAVTPKINEAVSKSADFEITIADMAKRSERRAWFVAWSAILMAVLLACGYFLMLPLKEKVPFLVMADAYTGTSTVARLRDFPENSIATSEAINKSNAAHYVLARESYDFDIMTLRDWATVNTMSANDVATSLQSLYGGPNSPYKIYGKGRSIRAQITSVILLGGENGGRYTGATVRFQRSLYDKTTGALRFMDNKIATLGFKYDPDLKMDEKERIANPLGFQVTAYRVDDDYAVSPPPAVPTAPPTSPAVAPGAAVPTGSVSASPAPTAPSLPATSASGPSPQTPPANGVVSQ